MTLKIVYDRNTCIGSGECQKIAPQWWRVANGKSNLLGGREVSKDTFELLINDSDLKLAKTCVERCPVNCIKVKQV